MSEFKLVHIVNASSVGTDQGKIKISSDDTTTSYTDGKLLAGEGIDFSVGSPAGNETLTILGEDATTTNKGIASFTTADFGVSSGAVSLGDDVVKDISTDSGVVTPSTHTFTITGGSGVDTSGAGAVVTIDADFVKDTTPQAGGDIDLNDYYIQLKFEPGSNDIGSGKMISATVDSNSTGIGCPLYMAADGHFDEADADGVATAPCVALALETGTGTKKVLLPGSIMRHDAWNWTTGPGELSLVFLSTTVGTLTQTAPSGVDDVVQVVGFALSDDVLYFNPQLHVIEHTG